MDREDHLDSVEHVKRETPPQEYVRLVDVRVRTDDDVPDLKIFDEDVEQGNDHREEELGRST